MKTIRVTTLLLLLMLSAAAGISFSVKARSTNVITPVANAGQDQMVNFGDSVLLDGSGSISAQDSPASLRYSWASLTSGIELSDSDHPIARFTAPAAVKTILIRLTVADSTGTTGSDVVRVTVFERLSNSVFVSFRFGSDSNPGSPQLPVRTVSRAFDLARAVYAKPMTLVRPASAVYLEAGDYVPANTLAMYNAMSLYGGFEVTDGGQLSWSRTAATPTRITAPWIGVPNVRVGYSLGVTLRVTGITVPTAIDGVTFDSSSAQVQASQSSNPLLIMNSSNKLTLTNVTVNAGRGGNGSKGSRGVDGADGKPGTKGGNAVRAVWGDESTPGGAGGAGATGVINGIAISCPAGGRGGLGAHSYTGFPGNRGSGVNGGAGGAGGQAPLLPLGSTGKAGAKGANGSFGGSGGAGFGSVVDHYWRPDPGTTGSDGLCGSGGGGGGASGTLSAYTGAAGGGGGGAGAQGTGGSGGAGGGASIGIFLTRSSPIMRNINVSAADGGSGGAGGDGGCGGLGGAGSVGGSNEAGVTWGGPGGWGGSGGSGGAGGGGSGGISAPLLITEDSDPTISFASYKAGTGGAGGSGGQGCAGAPDGSDGTPGRTILPPDSPVPLVTVPKIIIPSSPVNTSVVVPTSVGMLPTASSTFSALFSSGEVRITLISPSGRLISSESTDPDVQCASSDGFQVIRVASPEPGTWQIRISAPSIRPQGEAISVEVTVAPLKLFPTAVTGTAIRAEATSPAGARIVVDGTLSYDSNGDPLAHEWIDAGGRTISASPTAEVALATGKHRLVLSVRNAAGNASTQAVDVTVQDTTPPELSIPDPLVLVAGIAEARIPVDDTRIIAWKKMVRATDTADEHPQVSCDLPQSLEPGLTRVNFVAIDASGNRSFSEGFVMILTAARRADRGRVVSPRSR